MLGLFSTLDAFAADQRSVFGFVELGLRYVAAIRQLLA